MCCPHGYDYQVNPDFTSHPAYYDYIEGTGKFEDIPHPTHRCMEASDSELQRIEIRGKDTRF